MIKDNESYKTVVSALVTEATRVAKQAQDLEGAVAVEADAANVARITRAARSALASVVDADTANELAKSIGQSASNGHSATTKTTLGS